MRKLIRILIALSLFIGGFISCQKSSDDKATTFDVDLVLPSTIQISAGDAVSLSVKDNKAPLASDVIMLSGADGVLHACTTVSADASHVVFSLPASITSGTYTLSVKRDQQKKVIGKTYINIVAKIDFTPDASSTIYGMISCAGTGVSGVVVSDGIEVTATNAKGYYQLKSDKARGYVFMSVPSGYEAVNDGILPKMYFNLKADSSVQERVDFQLRKAPSQDSFQLIVFGDMHLARRTNDLSQFKMVADDVNAYMTAHKGTTMYGLTLGDMTWDLYWYDNSYQFPEYLTTMNANFSDFEIYHTMGNHDNNMKTYSDLGAEKSFTSLIAPTYYSYNIGKIHFIVLDDIDCSAYDGSTSRNYTKDFNADELDWLKKDLAYIDKSTTLVVSAHAPVYVPYGTASFKYDGASYRTSNTDALLNILDGYTTHFITGHTHYIFNVLPSESIVNGRNIYEHNSGAVCATWWWTGYYNPTVNIGQDGSPSGYQVFTFNGSDVKWQFKASGRDMNYQFRTYDRNEMAMSTAEFTPDADATNAALFLRDASDWTFSNKDNYVYFNVWNYNPLWTISVTENGTSLAPERVSMKDPLHLIAYEACRLNKNGGLSFSTIYTNHMFRVRASSATSTLEFKITDQFGNVYSESMTRPKAFNMSTYN